MPPTASSVLPTANSVPPGASPWALACLVTERLNVLATRYDDAAGHLDALASRFAELSRTEGWTGPGSRAFAARAQRHGEDTRGEAQRCREVAELVRQTATQLGQRVQDVERLLDLGGPLTGALAEVLGPLALGTGLGAGTGAGLGVSW